MIKMYDQVPQVYSRVSRDFQYMSWLINIMLNYVKHNVDDMRNLPLDTQNTKLTELLALTLGFKVKRKYDQKQLAALVSILPRLLKCKGTKKAIDMAGEALLTASGKTGTFRSSINKGVLEAVMPKGSVDTTLFMDLLPYILPAGITCRIVNKTEIVEGLVTDFTFADRAEAIWAHDNELSKLHDLATPVKLNTNILMVENERPEGPEDTEKPVPNVGLVGNNILPLLATDAPNT